MTLTTTGSLFLGLAFLAGCSGSEPVSPSVQPEPPDVSGTWSYSESFGNAALPWGCEHQGIIVVTQTGTGLTGSYSYAGACGSTDGWSHDDSGAGAIEGGEVVQRAVAFVAGPCSYTGAVSESHDTMAGDVVCIWDEWKEYVFVGTWAAAD